MADPRTQFFRLDTIDNSQQREELYAAHLGRKAVVFAVDVDGTAHVRYVLDAQTAEELRDAVQRIIDVVGFSESGRPTLTNIQPGAYGAQQLFLAEALEF